MNAKTYLRQIKWCEIKIDQRKIQLHSMGGNYTYIQGLDYSRDRVQTSPQDAMAEKVVRELSRMEKRRNEILQLIAGFEDLRNKIINQIQGMDRAEHGQLLFKIYVEHKDLLIVSREMGYAYQSIANMHGQALQAFAAKYLDNEKPLE